MKGKIYSAQSGCHLEVMWALTYQYENQTILFKFMVAMVASPWINAQAGVLLQKENSEN